MGKTKRIFPSQVELAEAASHLSLLEKYQGCMTYVASTNIGITIVSMFKRAAWALPQMLNIYAAYEPGGDRTVGRCSAGLDFHGAEMGVLPARFSLEIAELTDEDWMNIVPNYASYPDSFKVVIPFLIAGKLWIIIYWVYP